MDKLKIKTIKEKPRKVFAANVEHEDHLKELSSFLTRQPNKKFDLILNGRLIKLNSGVAKSKFVEGFDNAVKILMDQFTVISKEIQADRQKLLNEIAELKKGSGIVEQAKGKLKAGEMALELRAAAWKDRIVELEDACETLRNELREKPNVV